MDVVYVFTAEQAYDGDFADIIVRVFSSSVVAERFMRWFIREDGDMTIEKYAAKNCWDIEVDESRLYRAIGPLGYEVDHVECTITSCEIENEKSF
jgi:hypothetical protein